MSIRRPADSNLQPETFSFNKENLAKANKIIAKYPKGRQQSAVMPLLDLAQRQNDGWLPTAALDYVGQLLNMSYIKVYEVASFYTMFNLAPVGKFHIQVCGTTPCWLRGAYEIRDSCLKKLKINKGETTEDRKFTLSEVECLGACANAPMVQINDEYYEDLTPQLMEKLIDDLASDKQVKKGSQIGRNTSEPEGELTSLKENINVK